VEAVSEVSSGKRFYNLSQSSWLDRCPVSVPAWLKPLLNISHSGVAQRELRYNRRSIGFEIAHPALTFGDRISRITNVISHVLCSDGPMEARNLSRSIQKRMIYTTTQSS